MIHARLKLDRDFAIAAVDERLFGGFIEHLGRCIYGGLYEPGHAEADEDDFRTDVLELVRELSMPVMRYPGGNFVSGYNWEDGVGPAEQRPRRLDLAWKSLETNAFGTNEFVQWCRKAQTEPMLAVNLGTRGPEEARDLVEYCNHEADTHWSELRRSHGFEQPHNVHLWCLGNEVYGRWQMGHKTAAEYGRVACEAAKLMKWTDPSIELVLCGADQAWNAEVLEHAYEHVDYLSIHAYYGNQSGDTPAFLAKSEVMSDFIDSTVATCDHIASKRGFGKRMMIAFDEWNVWYHSHGGRQKKGIEDWAEAPPILEDMYTMEDALLVGSMLITLINRADRVKCGCLAQVVNVIAPIVTQPGGPAWRQTIFHPFAQASSFGRGAALRQAVECPCYDTKERQGVPYLTSASVIDQKTGTLTVFAVNRHLTEQMELTVDARGCGVLTHLESTSMRHEDLKAVNTCETPNEVVPVPGPKATIDGGELNVVLEPASWNVIRLTPAG